MWSKRKVFALVWGWSVVCCGLALAADSPRPGGIDPAGLDTGVQPGADFFQYANGKWIAAHPIPPEFSRWGSFVQLRDENSQRLRTILDELVRQGGGLEGERQKLRDFYATAMNQALADRLGAAPLKEEFEGIGRISRMEDLVPLVAHLRRIGISAPFSLSIGPDAKASRSNAIHLRQGGLGLPERDYYLGSSPDSIRIRREYRDHIWRMLGLLGDSPQVASAQADAVLRIEEKLAKASRAPVQLRDREAQYNPKTLSQLKALAPHFNWEAYFRAVGIEQAKGVIVGQPEFFAQLDAALESTPIAEWQAYFRWHVIHAAAPALGSAFEDENFRFYAQEMRGTRRMQPRWKRSIGAVDRFMGEALGKLYVEKFFPPQAKARMDELVKNVLAAYRQRIETRDWMGEATRKEALAKLAAVTPKIAYPEKWRDYSTLEVGTDSYVQNVLRAEAFAWAYQLSKLGKPVDRTEWHMTPPTVNAYYNGTMNEIVFPAGILQPPFFDAAADDAVNYGAIGAVIGHEITHGFDDQGSRSDGEGNLRNWWTTEDRARFSERAERLARQYDACVVVDDVHINGHLTLGENLADLGGIAIAYAAYQRSLGGKAAPVIDGLTGPQRFFIGYARLWRSAARDADQRVQLRTDPHSPGRFRTLVPLSNFQPFYDAFGVKAGDGMYRDPKDRVEVW